jgi:glycosyltransferase involved in cell wall biosynthesis
MKTLLAIPVYNEEKYVTHVLDEVHKYVDEVLVIDDGSTDKTPLLLAQRPVEVVRHAHNRGYGQSMIDAFRWATCQCYAYDWLITMDCDEQHEPAALPDFFKAIKADQVDVISGSRYMCDDPDNDLPPQDRRTINTMMTGVINDRLELALTDAFCGFKAYRVCSLRKLKLNERGYAFPMQFWVQAMANDLRIKEIPVKLIYNDPNRSFGGPLNDPVQRRELYIQVFKDEAAKFPERFPAPVESVKYACCDEDHS